MEYTAILKQAWQSTKKYKSMWWLGIFAAGGSFNFSSGSNFSGGSGDSSGDMAEDWFASADQWFTQYWWVLVLIVLSILVLSIIMWVASIISTGGLYYGAQRARLGHAPKFGEMVKVGMNRFWPVLGLNIVIGLGLTLVVLSGFLSLGLYAATIIGLVIVIPLFIVMLLALIPLVISVGMVQMYATQYVVLDQKPVMESLRLGWQLLMKRLSDSLVMYFLTALISIGFAVVAIIIALVIAGPFAIITYFSYNSFGLVTAMIFAGLGLVILIPILAICKGIFTSFVYHVWHLTFAELKTLK